MKFLGNNITTLADITSVTAGTGLSGGGTSGAVTLNVEAAQTGITSLGTLTALQVDFININGDTITAGTPASPSDMALVATGNDITVDTDNFVITSSTSLRPFLELKNTTNDNNGSILQFTKDKGAGGGNGDDIGTILWKGDNEDQEQTFFAKLYAEVSEEVDGDEAGSIFLQVASYDGVLTNGIHINGLTEADGEVDVVIASGAASTTTIAGTLTMGSTAAIDNSGVWVGGVIPSAKLNIAGLAPNTATTQATQPAIESIGTDGDTLSILGDKLQMVNTTASKPAIFLINQTDDATAPEFIFQNQRIDSGVQAGEDDDYLGTIFFKGYDDQGTPALHFYAAITAQIHDATSGEESGILNLQVANHDGGLGTGLKLTGGSADNEIDVTVGLGANSVVTIPGDIDLEGDIDVNGTLETDALTIAGATIAAIGTTAITTLGTIGTGVWNGTAIAHDYIGADAIENTNIADDAVETVHIGDDQVTFAKALGVTPNVFGSAIKLIPSDFMANDDGGNTKFGVGYVESAGDLYGMRAANNDTELYAFVSIPQGMKATDVIIHAKQTLAVAVFVAQINATTMEALETGNCNTSINITDTNSTATNFLVIQVTTASATNSKVYGGLVTIAAQ